MICNEPFYMSGVDIDDMKERMGIAVSGSGFLVFSGMIRKGNAVVPFSCTESGRAGTDGLRLWCDCLRGITEISV